MTVNNRKMRNTLRSLTVASWVLDPFSIATDAIDRRWRKRRRDKEQKKEQEDGGKT